MNSIDDFFEYFGILLLVINAFLFLYSFKANQKSKAYVYFTIYIAGICIIQLIGFILASFLKNNLFLSHFYFIIQFILLSQFYKEFFNDRQKKLVTILLVIVPIILLIQYCTKPILFYQFNILEIFITSVPLIIYSILFLYNSLHKSINYSYINGGILVYLTTSTIIYILGDYLSIFVDNKAVKEIWFINKILYVVYHILIFIEWKKNLRHTNK